MDASNSLRNFKNIFFLSVYFCLWGASLEADQVEAQAQTVLIEAEVGLKEKFENAFVDLICQENLLEKMKELLDYLDFLSVVEMGQETGKRAAKHLKSLWGEVLPFIQAKLIERGLRLEDLNKVLLNREDLWALSSSIASKVTNQCFFAFYDKKKIMEAINSVGYEIAVD